MDFLERMFLGFQTFRADLPCLPESGCPYVVTTASQTLPSAGKPLDVQRLIGTTLLSRQTYQYSDTLTLPRKSLLNRTDSYSYGSAGGTLQTYTTFPNYDAYGNVQQTISHGDASQTGDELQTDTTFVPNTTAYIVGLPAKVERRVPGGPALQTETFEYDRTGSYTQPAVWNATATKGDLTAVSRWLDQASKYVNRRMTYNTRGQLLTSKDETNRPTTTVYETTTGHSLFPATVTNPAGEATTSSGIPRAPRSPAPPTPTARSPNRPMTLCAAPIAPPSPWAATCSSATRSSARPPRRGLGRKRRKPRACPEPTGAKTTSTVLAAPTRA
jgi:hypothetical protein